MATLQQNEPSNRQQDQLYNDVKLSTQLSIAKNAAVSGDSTIKPTSTQQLFTCQTNINSFGNLSFPLEENYENEKEKVSFRNLKQFPVKFDLEKKVIDKFPRQHFQDSQLLKRKLKEIKLNKNSRFPLKVNKETNKFLVNVIDKPKKVLKFKKFKKQKLDLNLENNLQTNKNVKKSLKTKVLKQFPCKDHKLNKQFPFKENKDHIFPQNKLKNSKFPQITEQKQGNFPLDYKFLQKPNIIFNTNNKPQLEIKNLLKPIKNFKNSVNFEAKENIITKFPSETNIEFIQLSRFPLQSQNVQITTPNKQKEQDYWNKINNMKTTSSTTLSMTQFIQNIDNEHVSQVQDAQISIQENPLSPPLIPIETIKINENILQTPPQTTLAKTTNDGDNNKDRFILAAINSINNTQPNEKVDVYVGKIELIQNAIFALFETIQNTFRTNHNREKKHLESKNIGSSNAIIHGHEHDNDENAARFALTPPIMSVTTSGRSKNNERNEHSKEDLHSYNNNNINNKDIYTVDLDDLYDREVVGGQIVECCSDVRDTLAEAVDYGVTNNTPNRTGSFLVKSEESFSPNSPHPQTLKESTSPTTQTDYTKDNPKLLTNEKNNVFSVNIERQIDVKNNLEYETTNKTIDQKNNKLNFINVINRVIPEKPIENKECINLNISEKVREMTVTRLAESNENETTNDKNNHLQTNDALEHKADILTNDLEIDEMKYEMNKVKGALPSSTLTERARLGKHDSNITGSVNQYGRHNATNSTRLNTDTALGNSRLPTSLSSTRNYNDSSYTPRSSSAASSSLKSDNVSSLTHTPAKRSSVHTHLPQDSITPRSSLTSPSSLHDSSSHRSHLTAAKHGNAIGPTIDRSNVKPLNDHSSEISTTQRPSLGALRNIQSTSLLSVDLPHYSPSSTGKSHDSTSTLNKSSSIDSSVGDALPERTRLRRQRHLRSQDSQDEHEDPIERLNRLKARISASLSEVKGVLKQYSTEENENETKQEEEKKSEEPVKFRFVKKIRRRSLFTEEEEKAQKEAESNKESSESKVEKPEEGKDETDNVKFDKAPKLAEEINGLKVNVLEKPVEEVKQVAKHNEITNSLEAKESKLNKQLYTLKEENHEHEQDAAKSETQIQKKLEEHHQKINEVNKSNEKEQIEKKEEESKTKMEEANVKETESVKTKNDLNKVNKKDQIEKKEEESKPKMEEANVKETESVKHKNDLPIVKEEEQLKSTNESRTVKDQNDLKPKDELKPSNELQTIKEVEESKGAIAKPPPHHNKHETKTTENGATPDHTTKIKKKIVIKPKDPTRRASLAAVEGSKIEPPVKLAIPSKIQRRPSDSEAVVKKKLITAKINTSGIVEEVTPKPKIVKVKKSVTKHSASSQLATTQTKAKDEVETKINDKSNEQEKDNKSIDSDKNKDVLMPKHVEQQQKQEQINNDQITSQKNLLLPTQLVIDEAASLNLKTIENSVLQPNDQKQQQHDQQKLEEENKKQATTIQTTTTNLKSNDLQAGGAMLENLTTVLSSSKTSEANGQIKNENNAQHKDNLHDLLQQETTLIPQTTNNNKTNDVKEQQTTKLKDLLLKQQSTEKFQEKLDKQQDQQQQQQQEKTLTEQQVVATTDIAIVKSENLNKKDEDVKVIDSLKEPCIDKTPTSTHVVADQQQQQQHHNQLPVEGEQTSITTHTVADTKTLSSPLNSISIPTDIIENTTTLNSSNNTEIVVDDNITKAVPPTAPEQLNTMPELNLAPAPVQTAEILPQPEVHKKKSILKKIIRQTSQDKTKKLELNEKQPAQDALIETVEKLENENSSESTKDDLTEEGSESTELSETTTSEEVAATPKPKKERKVKKKVIIKRQKRRLSIGDSFFHPGDDEPQNTQIETLEKPIAYVSEDEDDNDDSEAKEEANKEEEEIKKPLKSCIMHKEYNIGDQVLYAERFKKTQIRWRRGRIKERITSISYLLDIDGKDVSSHINYLKKWTGRKVRFSGKEYLEIDYEQLAEEEERAEKLQRRTYSIWNMV